MKTQNRLTLLAAFAVAASASAQRGTLQDPPKRTPPPTPPRVWVNPDYYNPFRSNTPSVRQTSSEPVYVYDQQPSVGRPPLVTQEQAQMIIDRFKKANPDPGSPRCLIYVNRDLGDAHSAPPLIQPGNRTEASPNSGDASGGNSYPAKGEPAPTLTDKQTVRDVERLFGRPLRAAGASLVDQKVAAQLIAHRPLEKFPGAGDTPQARKDHETLAKVADVVIEILISSKSVQIPTIADSQTIPVPDIQATAISLKDFKILAQASSAEITNRIPPANLGQYGVNEITEATAFALMEDMTPNP